MAIENITFKDLENDENFLRGLREREFVLVLGAGFSFGVRNKVTDPRFPLLPGYKFPTIPIVSLFLEYTNKIFETEYTSYEDAAYEWSKRGEENSDILKMFQSMFLADPADSKLDLYKAIFIPKWHNIFSLNFDDVLCKIGNHEYDLRYYPQNTGRQYQSILHAHGYIGALECISKDIVFSAIQYANLNSNSRDLYDVLYTDVKDGKNLIIVGTQFKESIISNKFFNDLEDFKDTKIYHFDIDNQQSRQSPYFYERNYKFVKLNDAKFGFGTPALLSFFKSIQSKIYQIEIPEIKTIDRSFADRTIQRGESQKFSLANFYLGKQFGDYQWYGVLKTWDVERSIYKDIKNSVLRSFNIESHRRIAALVTGSGGAGKSTLLRRLAVDCIDEDVVVSWIDDVNILDFVQLRRHLKISKDVKYLFIIEDWYRIKQLLQEEQQAAFLADLNSFKKARICIGDRGEDAKIIEYLLEGRKQGIYHLSTNDNGSIINNISKFYPVVQTAVSQLRPDEKENIFKSALYPILFTLSRIEASSSFSRIELVNIEDHFRTIISSDMRALSDLHLGAVRFLVFYAIIYSKIKFSVSSELMKTIMIKLDPEKRKYIGDEGQLIIDRYLSSFDGHRGEQLLRFNQDLLAETGLSNLIVNPPLAQHLQLDTNVRFKLLSLLAESNDFGSPEFMGGLIANDIDKFEMSDLLKIAKKGFENKIYGNYLGYMCQHKDLNLNNEPLLTFFKTVFDLCLNTNERSLAFVSFQFFTLLENKERKQAAAVRILEHDNLITLPEQIVNAAFKIKGNEAAKQAAAVRILKHDDLITLQDQIVNAAFKIKGNEAAKQAAAVRILEHDDLITLQEQTVNAAFNSKGNEAAKQAAAVRILKHDDLITLQEQIVTAAFKSEGNEAAKQAAAVRILKHDDLITLQDQIVNAAFKSEGNEAAKQVAAVRILEHDDLITLQDQIVNAAFKSEGNEAAKQVAAVRILEHDDLITLQEQTVNAAFKSEGNEAAKQAAAARILEHDDLITLGDIVNAAFKIKGNEAAKQVAAVRILEHDDLITLQHQTVTAAFNSKGNEEAKQAAAVRILEHDDLITLQHQTVTAAFNSKGNEEAKQAAAVRILEHDDLITLQHQTVTAAFNSKGNEEAKQAVLEKWRPKLNKSQLPLKALIYGFNQESYNEELPESIKNLIEEFIDSYVSARRNKQFDYEKKAMYFYIMRSPYHQLSIWRKQTEFHLKNWRYTGRALLTAVLFANKTYEYKTKKTCEGILKSWETEIFKEVKFPYVKTETFGTHLRFAMGHPKLRGLTKKTALDMQEKIKTRFELPDVFQEIVRDIIDNNQFPNWE